MASFLILYSTTDGHTVEICRRLQQVIGQGGHRATVMPIGEATPEQLDGCDRIVIGADGQIMINTLAGMRTIEIGDADSCGTGYRCLRVAN